MFKNVASQKLIVYAFDATTGVPKTGDAANLTAYVSKDFGAVTVLGDTSATEMDATNAKGSYLFDLTQGETNADCAHFTGKSSTANIYIAPQTIYTDPPNYTATVIDSNGIVDADVRQLLGTAWLTPGTPGTPDVNAKLWNGLATVALPLVPTTAGRTLAVDTSNRALADVDTIKTNPVVNNGTTTFPTNKTLASTDNITAASGVALTAAYDAAKTAAQAGDAMALTSGERNSTADALLNRDMSVGVDSGSTTFRTMRQALRVLRNLWTISGGTLTVKKEDDTTTSWTSTMSTDAAAIPIVGSDPAGP